MLTLKKGSSNWVNPGLSAGPTGMKGSGTVTLRDKKGHRLSLHGSGSATRFITEEGALGPLQYSALAASAAYTIPWIDDKGTDLTLRTGFESLPFYNSFLAMRLGVGFATPIGRPQSPWSVLYGLDFEMLMSQVLAGELWALPYGGIQYSRDNTLIRITAGPGWNFNGKAYGQINITVSKKKPLTKKLYAIAQLETGFRYGTSPDDFLGSNMLAAGALRTHVTAKAGILYEVFNWLHLGVGVGATTRNLTTGRPVLAGGLMVNFFGALILAGYGVGDFSTGDTGEENRATGVAVF